MKWIVATLGGKILTFAVGLSLTFGALACASTGHASLWFFLAAIMLPVGMSAIGIGLALHDNPRAAILFLIGGPMAMLPYIVLLGYAMTSMRELGFLFGFLGLGTIARVLASARETQPAPEPRRLAHASSH
jgi:hypothetical protein